MSTKPKPTPYANTTVHYAKTQGEMVALLSKYNIDDVRFTSLGTRGQLILEFTKYEEINGQSLPVGVRIVIPGINEKNRNQLHRALFYYLKSKFESLEFGFIEFTQEFFPHLVIPDGTGSLTTVYEKLGASYKLGLSSGETRGLNLLPEGTDY